MTLPIPQAGYHRLLERQLRKWLPGYPHVPEEIQAFLHSVNESYLHYDNDRLLVETAMRESSDEISSKKRQLKSIFDHQSLVLDSLREAARKLVSDMHIQADDDLLYLADILQEEITRRQIAESRKQQTEERMFKLLHSLHLGMAEYDMEEKLTIVQPDFADVFGYLPEEIIGKDASFFRLGEFKPSEAAKAGTFKFSCQNEVFEAPLKRKNGETIWLLCTTAPAFDDNRQLSGGVMVVFDITSQKKLESELRHARRAAEAGLEVRKSILANVSHELRTPVNAIVGMSSLLSRSELSSVQEEYIQTMKFSSEGLLVLIDDLLDVSRIESGKVEMENIAFSMEDILKSLSRSLGLRADEKGLKFRYFIDPRISQYLYGDPHRIGQVLTNLISNAIKFTHKGEVLVSVSLADTLDDQQNIFISVRDTGIGIAPNRQHAVFQEFSQEDSSTTRKYGGNGLGLTISRKIVELMGGELKLRSEKNVGSEFYFNITLTITDKPNITRENFNPDMSGLTILLVEDNPINQYLATTLLKSWNAQVDTCINGREAIDALDLKEYTIILMDLQMPMMDGFEATEVIRNQKKLLIPIIALTANAISGEREKCLAFGMNEYVSKPFQPETLYNKIIQLTTSGEGRIG